MDGVETLLDELRKGGLVEGHFRGLLHILIGRKIMRANSSLISPGMTWRAVADLLKRLRWAPEAVRELGIDPESLPPRDRQRFWFAAISQAQIDSPDAAAAGDAMAAQIQSLGYLIGAAPRPPA